MFNKTNKYADEQKNIFEELVESKQLDLKSWLGAGILEEIENATQLGDRGMYLVSDNSGVITHIAQYDKAGFFDGYGQNKNHRYWPITGTYGREVGVVRYDTVKVNFSGWNAKKYYKITLPLRPKKELFMNWNSNPFQSKP